MVESFLNDRSTITFVSISLFDAPTPDGRRSYIVAAACPIAEASTGRGRPTWSASRIAASP
jgi:hypothetical protein